jgi:two-component system, NtrC family, sensor kinase
MEIQHYYRALMRNMMLIVILVSFAPLLLISALNGYRFETSYREKVTAHLMEVVQKHRQGITMFLNDKLAYLVNLANSVSLDQIENETFLDQKLAILQKSYGGVFVDLGVVDDRGIQVAYAGAFKLEMADYSQTEWFKKAIKQNYYISDVFLGLRRQPHFIITVKQKHEGKDWILRATIDFEVFNALVESVHIGETGLAFIINKAGEFQTKPRLEPKLILEFQQKFLGSQQLHNAAEVNKPVGPDNIGMATVQKKPHGDKGITVGNVNYAGKNLIYLTTPLKDEEWILVYQQEDADAFSDLNQTLNLSIIILVIGAIGIIVMAFLLSRKMVEYIKKADQDKEMMNEKVIEAGKLASVGELASGIAHEINNPIAIMVEEAGWIGDLLDEEDLVQCQNLEEFRRALNQIKTQGGRCKEITHKLLNFARKTDGRVREVLINDIIEEIVSISGQVAKYSNVKIVTQLDPELPKVAASPSEMQQVLLNLINNAIYAIGSGGGSIEITSRLNGEYVTIDVADTGQGIPNAVMNRIFDPFFTTKPVGKGTGLGLSICYGLIKKMGGDITIDSSVGMGATFHVHLPAPKCENHNHQ